MRIKAWVRRIKWDTKRCPELVIPTVMGMLARGLRISWRGRSIILGRPARWEVKP